MTQIKLFSDVYLTVFLDTSDSFFVESLTDAILRNEQIDSLHAHNFREERLPFLLKGELFNYLSSERSTTQRS